MTAARRAKPGAASGGFRGGPTGGGAGAVPAGAALVALSPRGIACAVQLKGALPGARVHALAARVPARAGPRAERGLGPKAGLPAEGRLGPEAGGIDEVFAEAADHLRRLFAAGTPIVAVCAAGIVVRALAPLVANKRAEPPVVAVAEDGSVAVPLLGGHRGANALARAVAARTGGVAAVTTAGEVALGLALDDPPPGWRVANPEAAKAVAAALLAGAPVRLRLEADDGGWLSGAGLALDEGAADHAAADGGAALAIRVTDRAVPPAAGELVLHPPVLALGVGCERGAGADEVVALAREALARGGLAEAALACVASIDLKEDEPAVHALGEALGVPVRFFDAAALEAEAPRLADPSDLVFRETGCHGVAEGAALAAAGPEATLAVAKVKSARATLAVARAPAPLDVERVGRGRGALDVVGIGPGGDGWLTPEAAAALAGAGDVVGYGLYLDLIRGRTAGKALHAYPMGQEEARVRRALDLAAGGRRVALVSSGDAGIYGLAALVFELLDAEDRPEWNRLEVSVQPGVSALQAAAARIGAPLANDFCAVSLSDLLTPWAEIERRLRAAVAGDFVVALYNPASARRRRQLEAARDILLEARPPETPAVVARNLGREGESVDIVSLAELSSDKADMLTVVLVGNSRTRRLARGRRVWVYTPRGYDLSGGGARRRRRGAK